MSKPKFGGSFKPSFFKGKALRAEVPVIVAKAKRGALAQATRRMVTTQVDRAISRRAEEKFIDTLQASAGVTNLGTLLAIASPAVGNTVNTRIGDSIITKRLEVQYNVTGYDVTNIMRVILFQWHNDDGLNAPAIGDIISAADVGTPLAPLGRLNWDQWKAKDFTVIMDNVHTLRWNNTTAAPGSDSQTVRKNIEKGFTKRIQLNAAAVTGFGNFYLLFISDSAVAGHPKFECTIRHVYTDM